MRQKFTGKIRDTETGLDYFEARYYSSRWGRFTTSDEFVGGPEELIEFAGMLGHNPTFYAELAEPQSLNKYQYVLNNPLRYVDPDGHQTTSADALWVGLQNTVNQTSEALKQGVREAGKAGIVVAGAKIYYDIVSSNGGPDATVDDCPSCGRLIKNAQDRFEREAEQKRGAQTTMMNQNADSQGGNQGGASGKNVTEKNAKNLAEAEAKGIPPNQLGPSGKPKINKVTLPTKKRAKDYAS